MIRLISGRAAFVLSIVSASNPVAETNGAQWLQQRAASHPLSLGERVRVRDRLVLFAAFACLLSLFCLSAGYAAGPKTPNILWLIAEDFGPHLGCYGTKEVFTPNLDRL